MKLTLAATGTATPELAWERYMDTRLWPVWAPQIQGVESSGDRLAAGVTGRVVGPIGFAVNFVVDDVDEHARIWTWHAWWQTHFLGLRLRHSVADDPRGSRTTLQIDGTPPLVLPYAPVVRFALTQLVKG
ncbi:SRPBCC family protein [Rhodococcoides yunnanense]|uniref:SRPBCC family protein n=1 Tax=Rhodococcoides yunnanense TaxID=278209 RepID=UPI00093549A0|nr:SRPBCC family protein [Rhodococcus yunnanensis]